MDAFWERLAELARRGEPVVTAVIVRARGATPRGVGARMIVRADGAVLGSVGGGCGEARVVAEAAAVRLDGRPRFAVLDLTGEMNDQSPTHCGGVMDVFIERFDRDAAAPAGLGRCDALDTILDARAAGDHVAQALVVANPRGVAGIPAGARWIVTADGRVLGAAPPELTAALGEVGRTALGANRSHRLGLVRQDGAWAVARGDDGAVNVFVETIPPRPALIVVGAGHIAVPLVAIAKQLDFHVTVVDDRPAFASRDRFPGADRIVAAAIGQTLRDLAIGPASHVVLVTRDHQHDEAALSAVIDRGPAYIGMIGSRRRVREVFRHLRAAGVPDDRIERVHAPIGLSIGAESPAEIAVAIVAEIVQVRRAPVGERPARAREVSLPLREAEERPGFPGAVRGEGDVGGHVGAPHPIG
ncbi:MAG: XdhC family protein [Candidatus Rokubacteria bacterium]|nr:XdhC family protein [Candidatus Rokubacteria bacterium]